MLCLPDALHFSLQLHSTVPRDHTDLQFLFYLLHKTVQATKYVLFMFNWYVKDNLPIFHSVIPPFSMAAPADSPWPHPLSPLWMTFCGREN